MMYEKIESLFGYVPLHILLWKFLSSVTNRLSLFLVPASRPVVESPPKQTNNININNVNNNNNNSSVNSSYSSNDVLVLCHGNVGRPGGGLTLYRWDNQTTNWTRLQSDELQRVYANHIVTAYIQAGVSRDMFDAGDGGFLVRCEARNQGDNERPYTTEKFIRVLQLTGENAMSKLYN